MTIGLAREERTLAELLNRLQRFGSLGDVGANLVFALIPGEGPDEGGRTRGSPLPAVLSRIAEAYLALAERESLLHVCDLGVVRFGHQWIHACRGGSLCPP